MRKKLLAKKLAVRCAEPSPKRLLFYNLSIHVAPNSTGEQLSRGRFLGFTMYGWEWLRSRYLSLWGSVENCGNATQFLEPIHVFLGTCCHASANSVWANLKTAQRNIRNIAVPEIHLLSDALRICPTCGWILWQWRFAALCKLTICLSVMQ
jgi:hypothetical protein